MSAGAATTDSGRSVRPFLQLLLVMALWGSAFAASKLAVHEVPPSVAAVLRFGCGAVALVLAVALLRQTLGGRVAARDRIRASLAGILGVFGYNAFFFWALHLAPSIDGSIIVPVLSPILTMAIAVLIGREAPSRVRVLGLAIGLAGAVVFFLGIRDTGEVSGNRLLGDLVFVLGAASWATYTLIAPRVLADVDPLRATTYATAFGAVLLGAWAIADLGEVRWADLPSGFWPNIAYLAVGPTAVAYLLYYRGVRAVGPTNASIAMFAVPIFGAICSAVLLGESLSSVQAVGGAVMLVGAFLAVTQGRLPRALTLRSRFHGTAAGQPGNV